MISCLQGCKTAHPEATIKTIVMMNCGGNAGKTPRPF